MPDARGSASTFCFRFGEGPCQQESVGDGLILDPDSATHGVVAPMETTPLANYENALAATRAGWLEDES